MINDGWDTNDAEVGTGDDLALERFKGVSTEPLLSPPVFESLLLSLILFNGLLFLLWCLFFSERSAGSGTSLYGICFDGEELSINRFWTDSCVDWESSLKLLAIDCDVGDFVPVIDCVECVIEGGSAPVWHIWLNRFASEYGNRGPVANLSDPSINGENITWAAAAACGGKKLGISLAAAAMYWEFSCA